MAVVEEGCRKPVLGVKFPPDPIPGTFMNKSLKCCMSQFSPDHISGTGTLLIISKSTHKGVN